MSQQDIYQLYDNALMNMLKLKLVPHFKKFSPTEDISDRFAFATAERPFGFDVQLDKDRSFSTLPTPLITLTRGSMSMARTRYNSNRWRKVRNWDEKRSYTVQSIYPMPWDIFYQVDLYCRYREDMNFLSGWFAMRSSPVRSMIIDFSYPWGKQYIDLIFDSVVDNSDIDAGETLRFYRSTLSLVMESYILESFTDDSSLNDALEHPDDFTRRYPLVHNVSVTVKDLATGTELSSYQTPTS